MNDDSENEESDVIRIRILEKSDQESGSNASDSDHSKIITCSHCGNEIAITSDHCPNCGVNLQFSSGRSGPPSAADTKVTMDKYDEILSRTWNKLSGLISGTAKVILFLVALGTALVGACFPPLWLLTMVLVVLLIAVEE